MHLLNGMTGSAYLTSGIGHGRTELSAFDAAELDANIIAANAVKVSSFVPPGWRIINGKADLERHTGNGVFLPMAYSFAVSGEKNAAASLLVGINGDAAGASIIVEHADVNITAEQSLEKARTCMHEAFSFRNWQLERIEEVAVEAAPQTGLYVCALVAVVFIAADTETTGYDT